MNDQTIKSENKFLGNILILSITIVTGMIFIPELQSTFDATFYNINDNANSQTMLAEATTNDSDYLSNENS